MQNEGVKGKKPAPNGMYWGSAHLSNGKRKMVMVEPLDEITYLAWTNSEKVSILQGWKPSEERGGWFIKEFLLDEIEIFNWTYKKNE
jgi:hypothetical protein